MYSPRFNRIYLLLFSSRMRRGLLGDESAPVSFLSLTLPSLHHPRVREALSSGKWVIDVPELIQREGRDPLTTNIATTSAASNATGTVTTSAPIFRNIATGETTYDLRMHLLLNSDSTAPRAAGGASNHAQVSDASSSDVLRQEIDSLTAELVEARKVIAVYESEVNALRCALFAQGGGSESSQGDKSGIKGASSTATTDAPATVLRQQLDAARDLNRRLFHRVCADRQQRYVCIRCGAADDDLVAPPPTDRARRGDGGPSIRVGETYWRPTALQSDAVRGEASSTPAAMKEANLMQAADAVLDDVLRYDTFTRMIGAAAKRVPRSAIANAVTRVTSNTPEPDPILVRAQHVPSHYVAVRDAGGTPRQANGAATHLLDLGSPLKTTLAPGVAHGAVLTAAGYLPRGSHGQVPRSLTEAPLPLPSGWALDGSGGVIARHHIELNASMIHRGDGEAARAAPSSDVEPPRYPVPRGVTSRMPTTLLSDSMVRWRRNADPPSSDGWPPSGDAGLDQTRSGEGIRPARDGTMRTDTMRWQLHGHS